MAQCQACPAPVFWRRNASTGRRAPVNLEPDPRGNVVMVGADEYRVLTKKEITERGNVSLFDMGEPVERRYTLHFATCPNADHFRRCSKCHKEPCQCQQ